MDVNFKLSRTAVATVSAVNKQAVFETLAERFAESYDLDAETVVDGLEERERLGSTGFGRGVAIPHARLNGIERPVAALLKLDSAVEFEAADGMPVDLVIGLLSPANAGTVHLHALAAISRMVRDDAIYNSLVRAQNSETLFAMLTNVVGSGTANDNTSGIKRERA
jgi:PTS system nitrogen regulatory IIA component